jgi:predicted MarR family transcription regulator
VIIKTTFAQRVVECIAALSVIAMLGLAIVLLSGCEILSKDESRVWQIESICEAEDATDIRCVTEVNRDFQREAGYGSVSEESKITVTDETYSIDSNPETDESEAR